MIVPIKIPVGAFRNGTEYQAKGRWRDVNLVRWHEDSLKPHSGWGQSASGDFVKSDGLLAGSGGTDTGQGEPVGAVAWVDNSENAWLAWATDIGGPYIMDDSGDLYNVDASWTTSDWVHMDTFGEIPLLVANNGGTIYEWDLNTSNNVTAVTNAPTDCVGMVVTDERFVFALKKREIAWCDREDRTVWTPAATNQAGSFPLDTEGEIMAGLQMRGEVLLVTTRDAYRAQYIGYPDVWEFRRIGRCSILGGNAAVRVDDRAFWWGDDGFYVYQGGYVQKLPCEVWDYVSADLSAPGAWISQARRRTFGWHNQEFTEVTWQYYSTSSSLIGGADKYVSFNYENGSWSYGDSPFCAVAPSVPFPTNFGLPDQQSQLFHPYTSDPGYTLGANWQIGSGVLNQSAPAASNASYDYTGLPVDLPLLVLVDVENRTAGTLTLTHPGGSLSMSGNGRYLAYGETDDDGAGTFTFSADGTWDGDISAVQFLTYPVWQTDDGSFAYPGISTTPYAKTGPFELGDGGRRVHVTKLYPDEQDAGELQFTFGHREYPTATEATEAAITAANPTDLRFSGRQFTMRVEPVATGVDWRSGTHRLEIKPGGKR